jgi:hypothetical protein
MFDFASAVTSHGAPGLLIVTFRTTWPDDPAV